MKNAEVSWVLFHVTKSMNQVQDFSCWYSTDQNSTPLLSMCVQTGQITHALLSSIAQKLWSPFSNARIKRNYGIVNVWFPRAWTPFIKYFLILPSTILFVKRLQSLLWKRTFCCGSDYTVRHQNVLIMFLPRVTSHTLDHQQEILVFFLSTLTLIQHFMVSFTLLRVRKKKRHAPLRSFVPPSRDTEMFLFYSPPPALNNPSSA